MFQTVGRAAAALLFLIPFTPARVSAQLPPDDALEDGGAVIGDVVVRVGDVFDAGDPREDRRLFRFANRLHRATRDEVIRNQLLFRPGDRYSHRLLEESERLLRQDRYLYDVTIRPVRYDAGRVDVEVITRDVWTLNVGAGLGAAAARARSTSRSRTPTSSAPARA